MRCLYCGKELALLKRWTGGGEFCSDAHRQRYQEEYNQLALNRLLQAKPPTETPSGPAKPAAPSKLTEPVKEVSAPARAASPEPSPSRDLRVSERSQPKPSYREPAPAVARLEAPVAVREHAKEHVQEPVKQPVVRPAPPPPPPPPVVKEEPPPAEAAGFLVELPLAALSAVAEISIPDAEFFNSLNAALPDHAFEPLNGHQGNLKLETAGLLTFQLSNRAANYTAKDPRERKLEVRDFVRSTPIVEIDLNPAGETGLETSSEAMDILFFPQPPSGSPALWQQPAVGFTADETELGELARLAFVTTGFSDQGDTDQQSPDVSSQQKLTLEGSKSTPPLVEESPHIEVQEEAVPEPVEAAPEPAPVQVDVQQVVERVAEPEPPPAAVEPVVEVKTEAKVEAAPEAVQSAPVPEPVTKPLPLVLQVAGPGKAKAVQIFSSASSAVNVQVPRSTSLPLRPVMTFGPTPVKEVEKSVEKPAERPTPGPVKSEPRKPFVPAAPLRPVSAKLRQPPELKSEAKPEQEAKAEVKAEPKQENKPAPKVAEPAKQAAKVENKVEKKPEVKEVKSKEDVKAEPQLPLPMAPSYGSSDLGLPRLNLQSSPGFFAQLPAVAKIGIAVALVAIVGGLIAFTSKGGGAAVTAANGGTGTVVVGSPLPIGDAGWITDWGADPGVRRTRTISVLRSSQTLNDYRIEMQGQIETKAIGWVFRAADPKNYYVTKIEIVKPGLEPTVALVRFAVINGEEQVRAQLPLPMKVRRDTMYKIRFDAVGSHFTTYVQDEKVDEWTDDQVKTGGVGLYSDRGEVATLKGGMSVLPLIVRR
jgi:hypothetical protein